MMITVLYLVFIVVQGAQPAQNTVAVSGRVTADDATRARVIRVAITNPATSETVTTVIDSDGTFEFSKVAPGSYAMRAFAATSVSTPITITVGSSDLTNLSIRMPEPKEIKGQITVEGNLPPNVPMPRLAFALAPAIAGVPVSSATLPATVQPDGSFTIALPEGERQITLPAAAIPTGYKLASVTYGTADLLKNPIRVSRTDTAQLRITYDATAIVPVRVTGRVANLLTTQGVRVVLTNPVFGSTEASVATDGSFAFSKVMPGNYVARLSLSGLSASRPVAVGNQDVNDVLITYPREFLVGGHIIVEGAGDAEPPQVTVEAKPSNGAGTSRTATSIVNGVLLLGLKDGEYNISLRSVPAGYQLKSITFGTTDLQKTSLKIDGPVTWEIVVRLTRAR